MEMCLDKNYFKIHFLKTIIHVLLFKFDICLRENFINFQIEMNEADYKDSKSISAKPFFEECKILPK